MSKVSEARTMTKEEFQQGYYVLACGCHAHVFKADLAAKVDLSFCSRCTGLTGVVRLSHILELANNSKNNEVA